MSFIALAVGLLAANLLGVGRGTGGATLPTVAEKPPVATGEAHSTMNFILNIFPDNFIVRADNQDGFERQSGWIVAGVGRREGVRPTVG